MYTNNMNIKSLLKYTAGFLAIISLSFIIFLIAT